MDQAKSTIIARMREILAAVAGYDGSPDQLPDVGIVDEIGLDSITALEYLITIEAEFGIEIADEDLGIDLVDSFETLADYVGERLAAPEAS
jgi:acyl carrier protein